MGDQHEEKAGEGQEQKATTPERGDQGQDQPALAATLAGPRAPDRRHRHLKEILGITSRPRPAQT